MIICNYCDWRYPDDYTACPRCDKPAPEDNMIQQWNSTLKADPSKRPKRSPIKSRSRKGNKLKKAMKRVGKKHLEENNGRAQCENCGMILPELRYSNISHIEPRSTAPEKREDEDNMEVLCSGENFWGKKDESCHSVWEANDYEKFRKLENSRYGQKGT